MQKGAVMNFSVAVIARNEAKTLPRLLASLEAFRGRGGEIVLVDTGSTDGTPDIARQAGCRVDEAGDRFQIIMDAETAGVLNRVFVAGGEAPITQQGDRTFDFASARNYAASLATHDFVAMPDCDEIYTALDLDAVAALAADPATDQIDSMFVFSHDAQGRDAIKFARSRFYRRSRMSWIGLQHESLTGLAQPRAVLVGEDTIRIEHWQNVETKRGQYLTGLALDCHRHPDNARNSHYLGRELLSTRRPHSAIRELQRHVGLNDWPVERAQSLLYMGDAYGMLDREQEQLDAYWRALLTDSSRRAPFLTLANYWFRKGDAQRTACFAAAALQVPWSPYYTNDHRDYTTHPHQLLSWAKWRLDDKAGAREHWRQALAFHPRHPEIVADARHFIDTPPVAILMIVDDEDPTIGAARIEATALYPDFEVIAGQREPDSPQTLDEVLRQMLPLASSTHVLFLEAGYRPAQGFLMQAMLVAGGEFTLLTDPQHPNSTACWLAPKALLETALQQAAGPCESIVELLPGVPFTRAELATVEVR